MYLIGRAQLERSSPSSCNGPSKPTLASELFYHDITVTYSPRTEGFKLRVSKKECNPEMFEYNSIKGFCARDYFGLPQKGRHRPHVVKE